MSDMAASLDYNNEAELRAWWLLRILQTPLPLQERLTLFWHNHFATSNAKVRNLHYMFGQNQLLRRNALGSFRTMLAEISKDPAMMIWLDTSLNKKGTANENYSRELMELFSLGIGHYTEQDVREGARAFTGWEIQDGKFSFNAAPARRRPEEISRPRREIRRRRHRANLPGTGRCGVFHRRQVVPLLRQRNGHAHRANCSSRWPLAFARATTICASLVETMLRSNLFFSPVVYRTQIKSPVDFAVGIVRALEGQVGAIPLADALEGLGQRLLSPPSVKGWPGGTVWINSTTLLLRHNLALDLTSTQDNRFGRRTDPAELARKYGKQNRRRDRRLLRPTVPARRHLADGRASLLDYLRGARKQAYPAYWSEQDRQDHRVRAVCHLLLTQAEFQLN